MSKKILVTAFPATDAHKDYLRGIAAEFGAEIVFKRSGLVPADLKGVSAVIGNMPTALIKEAGSLEWMQLNSAGADAYLAPEAGLPASVRLTSATGAFGLTVSEHMMAMTYALVRRFNEYIRQQRTGEWQPRGAIISVEGSTVLLLGLGDIGSAYARKVRAGGAYVIGLRRHVGEKPEWLDELHGMDELDSLLPRADIVVMVLPGGPATYHLMDERRMRLMKKGSYLINVGRGSSVDCEALKKLLREEHLAAAALDVTDPEPLPADSELWQLGNLIITPHVAGQFYLAETVNRIVRIAGENMRAWLTGQPLRNLQARN